MTRPETRLIVSFLGNTDIKYSPGGKAGRFIDGNDMSPVMRMLVNFPGGLIPRHSRILLFDDRPDNGERRQYVEDLQQALPELGLTGLDVTLEPITLPAGPTDLNALYEKVWPVIRRHCRARDQLVFHLTSGTAPMQLTLLLAAHCLRLGDVLLLETSVEHGVLEVRPPYVLAARDAREREHTRSPARLIPQAKKSLLPDTVVEDTVVQAAYAALHKAAVNLRLPPRIVIEGPGGSGKWHAARQFAAWRGTPAISWTESSSTPEIPAHNTLLIRHLDAWPEQALRNLSELAATRPDLAIVATFRTDRSPSAPSQILASEGLRGAAHVTLPAVGVRSDVIRLGEALAGQLGLADGKLRERLGFDWLTDIYPNGMHDMKTLLATAGLQSPGLHTEQDAYARGRSELESHALLASAWRDLVALDFKEGRSLEDVLSTVRHAVTLRAKSGGRSQKAVARLLHISQTKVSDILRKPAPSQPDTPEAS